MKRHTEADASEEDEQGESSAAILRTVLFGSALGFPAAYSIPRASSIGGSNGPIGITP